MPVGRQSPDGQCVNVTGGPLLHFTMWAALAGISTIFPAFKAEQLGRNSTWIDFIPHSTQSKYF